MKTEENTYHCWVILYRLFTLAVFYWFIGYLYFEFVYSTEIWLRGWWIVQNCDSSRLSQASVFWEMRSAYQQ